MRVFPSADVFSAHAADCGSDFGEVFGAQELSGFHHDVVGFFFEVEQVFQVLWERHANVVEGFLFSWEVVAGLGCGLWCWMGDL